MEYHAHSAVNQFPESRISVTCPLPAGARRKLSRPSSFQPRECQGICAYCCVDDWLCGVQRIFAICITTPDFLAGSAITKALKSPLSPQCRSQVLLWSHTP